MSKRNNGDKLEQEYYVSKLIIFYKFILGIFEILLGFGIFFGGRQMFDFYMKVRNDELLENSHDLVAYILQRTIPYFFEHQAYVVFVLLALGFVKVIGAVGLYQRRHWGLDLLVALTVILLPIDGYNLLRHPSFPELGYFLINVLISLYLVNFKPKHYFIHLKKRANFRVY
ncbi:MAG: DUF2127 domain-containing protein [Actinobacteria bacterium]|nr:DUF2127 domain-containing protein [Actinomycetota bacterium]